MSSVAERFLILLTEGSSDNCFAQSMLLLSTLSISRKRSMALQCGLRAPHEVPS